MFIPIMSKDKSEVEIVEYKSTDLLKKRWFLQFHLVFLILATILITSYSMIELESFIKNFSALLNPNQNQTISIGIIFRSIGLLFLVISYLAIAQASAENFAEQCSIIFNRKLTFEKVMFPLMYILFYGLQIYFLNSPSGNLEVMIVLFILSCLSILGIIAFYKYFGRFYFFVFFIVLMITSTFMVNQFTINTDSEIDKLFAVYMSLSIILPLIIIFSFGIAFFIRNFLKILIQEYHSSNISKKFIYKSLINQEIKLNTKVKNIAPLINIRNEITKWVVGRNLFNLLNAILLLLVFGSIFIVIFALDNEELLKKYLVIMFILIFIRLFSRSSEIIYSFYKDIVIESYWRNTFLSKGDRIALAIKSLMEIIILSSLATAIIIGYGKIDIIIEYNFRDLLKLIVSYITVFMRSISISLFNISFPLELGFKNIESIFLNVIHLIQVVTSAVLITLSIAGYMGRTSGKEFYNVEFINKSYLLKKYIYNKSDITYKIVINKKATLDDLKLELEELWSLEKITDKDFNYCMELLSRNLDS